MVEKSVKNYIEWSSQSTKRLNFGQRYDDIVYVVHIVHIVYIVHLVLIVYIVYVVYIVYNVYIVYIVYNLGLLRFLTGSVLGRFRFCRFRFCRFLASSVRFCPRFGSGSGFMIYTYIWQRPINPCICLSTLAQKYYCSTLQK